MSTIPKLIKDTEKYFQYEGSANPTTQDELQAYMKNEHSVVECLTDALWQPETVYTIGHIVKSPNMPKGFQAVCLVNGTSSSNEPNWGSGATDITDGSTKWKVTTANITVNGISPDASGNISILDWVYPVGSLYWSKKSTDPATLFGGTWTRIKDKFILAAGDSYAQGATGGSATVTLTADQLPTHSHSAWTDAQGSHIHGAWTDSQGWHTHLVKFSTGGEDSRAITGSTSVNNVDNSSHSQPTEGAGSHGHNIGIDWAGEHSHNVGIGNTGSGQAHENMPPYVAYYCWERTA